MNGALNLTRRLGGSWHGTYGVAFCPAHENRRSPALSLANGADGRLLLHCFAGCGFADIIHALREIDEGGDWPTSRQMPRRSRDRAVGDPIRRRDIARRLWGEARPAGGSIVEAYLRGRGISSFIPKTLRFHASCRHSDGTHHPAMLARVDGAAGFAVHRTYLRPDGIGKADISPSKAMLGTTSGGAARLSDTEGPLVVCEGIETGLSLLSGLLHGPATVWAALSTSGIRSLNLPPDPHRLTIASDGDAPGRSAAHDLAARASGLGWRVSLLPAPEGQDWNDIINMKRAVK